MGKTAVFVISTLQMLKEDPENQDIQVLVIAHTRELAFQIQKEYIRFTQYMPNVKTEVFSEDATSIWTRRPWPTTPRSSSAPPVVFSTSSAVAG